MPLGSHPRFLLYNSIAPPPGAALAPVECVFGPQLQDLQQLADRFSQHRAQGLCHRALNARGRGWDRQSPSCSLTRKRPSAPAGCQQLVSCRALRCRVPAALLTWADNEELRPGDLTISQASTNKSMHNSPTHMHAPSSTPVWRQACPSAAPAGVRQRRPRTSTRGRRGAGGRGQRLRFPHRLLSPASSPTANPPWRCRGSAGAAQRLSPETPGRQARPGAAGRWRWAGRWPWLAVRGRCAARSAAQRQCWARRWPSLSWGRTRAARCRGRGRSGAGRVRRPRSTTRREMLPALGSGMCLRLHS